MNEGDASHPYPICLLSMKYLLNKSLFLKYIPAKKFF